MRCGLVLVAACSSSPRAESPPDAAPDADVYCDKADAVPIALTGTTTPGGTLDDLHFATARHGSLCGDGKWDVYLWADAGAACPQGAMLTMIDNGGSVPGSFPAEALLADAEQTTMVTFEATALDRTLPNAHLTGRFVSHDPAWTFDIAVDMDTDFDNSCGL